MNFYSVKNLNKYQVEYHLISKWIKLYYSILDDYHFIKLTSSDKWLYISLILIASKCKNHIPDDVDYIQSKIGRFTNIEKSIKKLMNAGFVIYHGDIKEQIPEVKKEVKEVIKFDTSSIVFDYTKEVTTDYINNVFDIILSSNLNNTQKTVEVFKVLKGYNKLPNWNKYEFVRHCRIATQLYERINDINIVIKYLVIFAKDYQEKRLEWTIETVYKKVPDYEYLWIKKQ